MSVADALQPLARQVLALCSLLKAAGLVRTYPDSHLPEASVISFNEDYEPGELLSVSPQGIVLRFTCEYSHHNGDSYDEKNVVLDHLAAHAALQRLHDRLMRMATKRELQRMDDKARDDREQEARRHVEAFLAEGPVP